MVLLAMAHVLLTEQASSAGSAPSRTCHMLMPHAHSLGAPWCPALPPTSTPRTAQ